MGLSKIRAEITLARAEMVLFLLTVDDFFLFNSLIQLMIKSMNKCQSVEASEKLTTY